MKRAKEKRILLQNRKLKQIRRFCRRWQSVINVSLAILGLALKLVFEFWRSLNN